MLNPFDQIDQRLSSIESLLQKILESSPEPAPDNDYISAKEAAAMLNRSLSRLYSTIQDYPHKKVGGKLIFSKSELKGFIDNNSVKSKSDRFNETEEVIAKKMSRKHLPANK